MGPIVRLSVGESTWVADDHRHADARRVAQEPYVVGPRARSTGFLVRPRGDRGRGGRGRRGWPGCGRSHWAVPRGEDAEQEPMRGGVGGHGRDRAVSPADDQPVDPLTGQDRHQPAEVARATDLDHSREVQAVAGQRLGRLALRLPARSRAGVHEQGGPPGDWLGRAVAHEGVRLNDGYCVAGGTAAVGQDGLDPGHVPLQLLAGTGEVVEALQQARQADQHQDHGEGGGHGGHDQIGPALMDEPKGVGQQLRGAGSAPPEGPPGGTPRPRRSSPPAGRPARRWP